MMVTKRHWYIWCIFGNKLFVDVLELKEMTLKVLNCMSSFISIPAIIQQILQVSCTGDKHSYLF